MLKAALYTLGIIAALVVAWYVITTVLGMLISIIVLIPVLALVAGGGYLGYKVLTRR